MKLNEMLKPDIIESQLDKDINQLKTCNQHLKFYHPDLSKDECEVKLLEYRQNSSTDNDIFVLRNESNNSKNFILSVLASDQCWHHSILHVDDCYFKTDNETSLIHGVEALVEKYKIEHFIPGQHPPSWSLKYGITQLLHKVVQNECFNLLIQILINPKCNQINAKNSNGRTPLHEACARGSQMAEILLKSGALINSRDSNGYTPLHICCLQGHDYLLDLLINQYNSNVNDMIPETGQTPLHLAAINNKTKIIKLLVKTYGALLNLKTKLNETALDLAKSNNSTDAVKYIERLIEEISSYGSHEDWYHETASDRDAISLLDNFGRKDGLFLIVKSQSKHGFKIGQSYKTFQTLESLVNFYCNNFTSLGCILNSSITKDGKIKNFSASFNRAQMPFHHSHRFQHRESLRIKPNEFERNRSSLRVYNSKRLSRLLANDSNSSNHQFNINDKFNISKYDIEVKYKIGEGEYGNVYRGNFYDQTGKCIPVAIKQLKHHEKQKDFLRESKIMSMLNHDCIVKFHGYCSETKMILLELIFMGSLYTYMKANYSQIGLDLIKTWCIQIADGMRYLESINIIHRDLASRNILIKTIYQVKITDFGMARKIMPNEVYYQDSTQRIPFRWYPLESIENNIFTPKSDVWSYGVTIWEIFSFGMIPFENLHMKQLAETLKRGSRLIRPFNCSSSWYNLMLQCWNLYPLNRPTFDFIFNYLNKDYRSTSFK